MIFFFSSLFCLFLYRKRFCDDETNLCVLFGFKPFFFFLFFFFLSFHSSHLIPPKVNIQSNKIRSCLYYFFLNVYFLKTISMKYKTISTYFSFHFFSLFLNLKKYIFRYIKIDSLMIYITRFYKIKFNLY